MPNHIPIVVRWGDVPLDMTSIIGKFKRSDFNAFYTDPARGFVLGHWVVEDGYEEYGTFPETYAFYIVEGTATVETDEGNYSVGPGDTVLVLPGRRLRFVVKEPVKVLYVTSGAQNIEKAQEIRRQAKR
ncbi:MAG: AraC family ligand binding domain-containing protein [Anaerolineae bacterium]|nr:AraC family ligand binding domain-containing protein [Anaerolineae bacterium]